MAKLRTRQKEGETRDEGGEVRQDNRATIKCLSASAGWAERATKKLAELGRWKDLLCAVRRMAGGLNPPVAKTEARQLLQLSASRPLHPGQHVLGYW